MQRDQTPCHQPVRSVFHLTWWRGTSGLCHKAKASPAPLQGSSQCRLLEGHSAAGHAGLGAGAAFTPHWQHGLTAEKLLALQRGKGERVGQAKAKIATEYQEGLQDKRCEEGGGGIPCGCKFSRTAAGMCGMRLKLSSKDIVSKMEATEERVKRCWLPI